MTAYAYIPGLLVFPSAPSQRGLTNKLTLMIKTPEKSTVRYLIVGNACDIIKRPTELKVKASELGFGMRHW